MWEVVSEVQLLHNIIISLQKYNSYLLYFISFISHVFIDLNCTLSLKTDTFKCIILTWILIHFLLILMMQHLIVWSRNFRDVSKLYHEWNLFQHLLWDCQTTNNTSSMISVMRNFKRSKQWLLGEIPSVHLLYKFKSQLSIFI